MTFDKFKFLINELKKINYEGYISYHFYNEPLLHPELDKFVECVKGTIPKAKSLIYTNGTKLNLDYFRRLIKSGVHKFIVTKHENVKNFLFNEVIKSCLESEKKYFELKDYSKILLTNRAGAVSIIKSEIPQIAKCEVPLHMMTITLNGNILPCFEDFFQSKEMGNLYETSLINIWNSAEYIQFREDLKKGLRFRHKACSQCSREESLFDLSFV